MHCKSKLLHIINNSDITLFHYGLNKKIRDLDKIEIKSNKKFILNNELSDHEIIPPTLRGLLKLHKNGILKRLLGNFTAAQSYELPKK